MRAAGMLCIHAGYQRIQHGFAAVSLGCHCGIIKGCQKHLHIGLDIGGKRNLRILPAHSGKGIKQRLPALGIRAIVIDLIGGHFAVCIKIVEIFLGAPIGSQQKGGLIFCAMGRIQRICFA